jgi:hypothetical protein
VTDEYLEPRQERREKRRESRKTKMEKHGKGLVQIYRDAIFKRLSFTNITPVGIMSNSRC